MRQSTVRPEWIVVDGASQDGTQAWLKASALPDVWLSERDRGIYDAMNKGVLQASGEYLLFLNAGDEFADEHVLRDVEAALVTIGRRPDVLFCDAILCLQNGRTIRRPAKRESYIWHGIPANHQATFYKKTCLPKPTYDIRYSICGDYYLAAAVLNRHANAVTIPRDVVRFYIGGKSFQSPIRLVTEAWTVQKRELRTGVVMRSVSAVRRSVAIALLYIINLRYWRKLS